MVQPQGHVSSGPMPPNVGGLSVAFNTPPPRPSKTASAGHDQDKPEVVDLKPEPAPSAPVSDEADPG